MPISFESDVPRVLRELRRLLEPLPGDAAGQDVGELAARAIERLDRDLLPRTAGGHEHLVVGIVGPNNAGKSALFNGLVGRDLSPSLATGGATRRLVGAAPAVLAERLASEPTLAQFAMRVVTPGAGPVTEALESCADPAELLLVEVAELPEHVLLIDTPDFDSILTENRRSSEALLAVCDLAVVVVTRHTYQNREVVAFLETWLAHGRPWMLVYNESLGDEVTREHAKKLAADLSSEPVGVFHAPFALEVQQKTAVLEAFSLADAPEERVSLAHFLFDRGRASELKDRALASAASGLESELRALADALELDARRAAELLDRAHDHARVTGRRIAGEAMPMAPFLEAFRAVLDRRPGLMSGGVRGFLRRTRLWIEEGFARMPFSRKVAPGTVDRDLASVERSAVSAQWPAFFERTALELAPVASELDPASAASLARDLDPDRSAAARERTLASLGKDPELLAAFREACERQIEQELAERGDEWFFQIAVDALHFLPALAAGFVIFHTGGLGVDVAVGGAGAFSSLLAERLSRLLGTGVARRARERWRDLRGERLAEILVAAALDETAPTLVRRASERADLARRFRTRLEALPWEAIPVASR